MNENLVTKEYLGAQFEIFAEKILKQIKDMFDVRFDEFALSVAHEFKEVRVEIYDLEDRLNNRFDRIESHINKIEGHIGRMEIRFSHLDEVVVKDHTPRIRRLEGKMGI